MAAPDDLAVLRQQRRTSWALAGPAGKLSHRGRRISALAIGYPKMPPIGELYRVRQDRHRTATSRAYRSARLGGLRLHATLPPTVSISFKLRLFRTNLGTMRGLEYPHQLEISVRGARASCVVRRRQGYAASSENPTITGDQVDGRFTARVPLKAGPREITVAFIEKTTR